VSGGERARIATVTTRQRIFKGLLRNDVCAGNIPIDIIEIDYNFRRAESTGRKGKMVIVRRIVSVNTRENNAITFHAGALWDGGRCLLVFSVIRGME
jgi:hypothetical protein